MSNWIDRSHRGDCRDLMRAMIADGVKVQTIVTSPPYWGLRSYLPDGHPDKHREIGQEPTLREFIDTLGGVFELARELLADDGTLWLNMGDSYAANRSYQVASTLMNGDATNQAQAAGGRGMKVPDGLKPKDLVGQPWRLAFALQDAGWYLRQDIIWHKPNPMPESVRDRCTKAHEYLFLLSKSERYYFDADAIRTPYSGETKAQSFDTMDYKRRDRYKAPDGWDTGAGAHGAFHRDGRQKGAQASADYQPKDGANRRSVWTIPTQAYPEAHFATFPEALVEPCVLAGSRPGDVVFDPFFGSGTTGEVAQRLGRHFVGLELNPEYGSLQRNRLRQPSLMLGVS
ncbi:DNA-methyltransferase [Burkholderia ambifaria]|uniref:DNA-methyltransferase n=1 Tax=Burkholderia ambifaria TaxID=152480 RepID=UPI00158B9B72|nr:site-specific DNA-methyltransferase [Burkholderia ambifaria]